MALFEVSYEDVGYGAADTCNELDDEQLLEFIEARKRAGKLPDNIRSMISATYFADDSVYKDGIDEDGNDKVFVAVRLLIETDDVADLNDLEDLPIPTALLKDVAEFLSPGIDMERNWELVDSDRYEEDTVSHPDKAAASAA